VWCRFEGVAIKDLLDGVGKRVPVGGPSCAAPGDVAVGAYENSSIVADFVLGEEGLVVIGQAGIADRVAGDGHPRVLRRVCCCASPEFAGRSGEDGEARAEEVMCRKRFADSVTGGHTWDQHA
jgi:hypothetical protein